MWFSKNGCHLVYEYMLSNVTITDLTIVHKTRSFYFPLDFTSKFSMATIYVRRYHFKKICQHWQLGDIASPIRYGKEIIYVKQKQQRWKSFLSSQILISPWHSFSFQTNSLLLYSQQTEKDPHHRGKELHFLILSPFHGHACHLTFLDGFIRWP